MFIHGPGDENNPIFDLYSLLSYLPQSKKKKGYLFEQVQGIGSKGCLFTILIVTKHWKNNVKYIVYVNS